MSNSIKKILIGFAGATILATAANAGGFSRGTADTDILFEDGNFNMRAGVTIVNPTRKYTASGAALGGLVPAGANIGTDYADTYAVPTAAIKVNLTEQFRCAGTVATPYGASATTTIPTGASGKVHESFTVTELGATCAFFIPLSKGRVAMLGGVFNESFSYDLATLGGALRADLASDAVGYRIGVAYEIPEIALRAQVMYRSEQTHNANGNTTRVAPTGNAMVDGLLPLGVTLPVATGGGLTPQSVELKLQSGVAPGWLVFGGVKWTDWSRFERLRINIGLGDSFNDYFYKDGWDFNVGVGHQFNEQLSGALFAAYSTDVGTGFDLAASTLTFGTQATAKGSLGEVSFGAGVSFLGSSSDVNGNAVGNDTAYFGNAAWKIKF